MKKTPKTLWWLDTGIFPATVLFIHKFSYAETKKLLKKKKATGWLDAFGYAIANHPSGDGGCWANSTTMEEVKTKEKITYFFIYIPTFQFTDYDYCKLAHEVLHIVQFMLPDILDRNKEHEAECYLHTHIMKQCLKALRDGK